MKVSKTDYCLCQSHKRVLKKCLFGVKIKEFWKKLQKDTIKICWVNSDSVEEHVIVPVSAYCKICPDCMDIIRNKKTKKEEV